MTTAAPADAAAQNTRDGRWPRRSAEKAAVATGSAPITTAECAVDAVCSARVVSKGNPMAHPPATTASAGQSRRDGTGARVASSAAAASSAATDPRVPADAQGPKPPSAHAVAGKLNEKLSTPRAAKAVPLASGDICVLAIALLSSVMSNDSCFGRPARERAGKMEPLSPGSRIPTHRELVRRYGVSATTVAHAL